MDQSNKCVIRNRSKIDSVGIGIVFPTPVSRRGIEIASAYP
jgi:hypothetical protein